MVFIHLNTNFLVLQVFLIPLPFKIILPYSLLKDWKLLLTDGWRVAFVK